MLEKNVLNDLQSFLPKKALLIDEDVSLRTAGGLHTEEPIEAKVIVRPETTQEVSQILALCNKYEQKVVVHGGLTGLVVIEKIINRAKKLLKIGGYLYL